MTLTPKEALTRISDDIGDTDSFVETFDPEFWDDQSEELECYGGCGEKVAPDDWTREWSEVHGRFGKHVQEQTNEALGLLDRLIAAAETIAVESANGFPGGGFPQAEAIETLQGLFGLGEEGGSDVDDDES